MSFRVRCLILMLLFAVPLCGCVRRRLTLRSDPPGAVAYLDNVKLGKTPISRNFDFYGKREIRLVKDGYETHTELVNFRPPWYQWIGLDFVSEVLVPGTISDERFYSKRLKPQKVVSPDDLIAEGERLKAVAHSSGSYRVSSRTPNSGFGSSHYDPSTDYRYDNRSYHATPGEALEVPAHDVPPPPETDPNLYYPSLHDPGLQPPKPTEPTIAPVPPFTPAPMPH